MATRRSEASCYCLLWCEVLWVRNRYRLLGSPWCFHCHAPLRTLIMILLWLQFLKSILNHILKSSETLVHAVHTAPEWVCISNAITIAPREFPNIHCNNHYPPLLYWCKVSVELWTTDLHVSCSEKQYPSLIPVMPINVDICRAVVWSTKVRTARFRFRFPMNSRNNALGSTQLLKHMSTSNLSGGKAQPACKACNLTAICMLIV
jgi:hypothetical protein